MFPMIVSVGMCDLLRSGNLRVMEVHDQTLALSSIVVDLFFKISVDGHALQKFGGWKRKGCSLSAFTQFPIQKEKILPSTLAKNVDELWASAVPKNHPATVNKGCCTNGDVPSGALTTPILTCHRECFTSPEKKGARLWADLFQILSYSYRYYRYYYDHVLQVPSYCVWGSHTMQGRTSPNHPRFLHRPIRSWQAYRKEVNDRKETGKRLKCVA